MAELSDKDRKKLKDSDFAEPDQRKYPIEDETHARNALGRVAQHGSEEEQREVRRRVEERYPDLKQD
ncbi:hypothetical protein QDR37_11015 [Amnibacterium sp. CER49]|uniref:DUF6582 domain-containing protein n=1 Tax=Amnibacterium sp. CER49 TaxID=3039161 RepID=UPI002447CDE6|nr:DUF6582 domain-containing protein [Amnibacterium sp. CER49]MDH2444474.1 hypothetical protein [Amnibacterium sp. CER49]